jgi:peptide/nickel transport system substrate-binding protein
MVDSWHISADKLTYTFILRDGLKWHDGAPVTSEDCIASIKRWAAAMWWVKG